MRAQDAFLAVAAAHAAFQLTVTLVVYPALAEVPESGWGRAHELHARRITAVVAVLYPALVVLGAWLLLAAPDRPATYLALGGTALALLTTALVAAPAHGRLGRGRTPALVARLLRADRVRTLGALVGLAGALVLAL